MINTMLNMRLLKKIKLNYYDTIRICRRIHNIGMEDIPRITLTDIRKILRQKGYPIQDGFTSLTIKCSICTGDNDAIDSQIHVNKTTGM